MARMGIKRIIDSVPKKPSHPTAMRGLIEYWAERVSLKIDGTCFLETYPLFFLKQSMSRMSSDFIAPHTFDDKLGRGATSPYYTTSNE